MSLLTMVQRVCRQVKLPVPTAVISSTNPDIQQMRALADDEGKELAKRRAWTELTVLATHTTIAAENQGAMLTLFPDFARFANGTMWNRTNIRPLPGPLTAQQWQSRQAQSFTGPYYDFRLVAGNLRMFPTPPAGETVALEYISKKWCQNAAGSTNYTEWNADTDVGRIDEQLMTKGLRWRFLQANGFAYEAYQAEYEGVIRDAMSHDGGRPIANLDGESYEGRFIRGITVPEGSWSP